MAKAQDLIRARGRPSRLSHLTNPQYHEDGLVAAVAFDRGLGAATLVLD